MVKRIEWDDLPIAPADVLGMIFIQGVQNAGSYTFAALSEALLTTFEEEEDEEDDHDEPAPRERAAPKKTPARPDRPEKSERPERIAAATEDARPVKESSSRTKSSKEDKSTGRERASSHRESASRESSHRDSAAPSHSREMVPYNKQQQPASAEAVIAPPHSKISDIGKIPPRSNTAIKQNLEKKMKQSMKEQYEATSRESSPRRDVSYPNSVVIQQELSAHEKDPRNSAPRRRKTPEKSSDAEKPNEPFVATPSAPKKQRSETAKRESPVVAPMETERFIMNPETTRPFSPNESFTYMTEALKPYIPQTSDLLREYARIDVEEALKMLPKLCQDVARNRILGQISLSPPNVDLHPQLVPISVAGVFQNSAFPPANIPTTVQQPPVIQVRIARDALPIPIESPSPASESTLPELVSNSPVPEVVAVAEAPTIPIKEPIVAASKPAEVPARPAQVPLPKSSPAPTKLPSPPRSPKPLALPEAPVVPAAKPAEVPTKPAQVAEVPNIPIIKDPIIESNINMEDVECSSELLDHLDDIVNDFAQSVLPKPVAQKPSSVVKLLPPLLETTPKTPGVVSVTKSSKVVVAAQSIHASSTKDIMPPLLPTSGPLEDDDEDDETPIDNEALEAEMEQEQARVLEMF